MNTTQKLTEKIKIIMMLQHGIGADRINITHRFIEDNEKKLIELYRISDAVSRTKY